MRTDINTREYIRKIKNSQSIDEINSLIKRWENKIKSSKELIITKDGKENERKILQQSTVYFCIKSDEIIKLLTPDVMQALSIQEETNLDLEKSQKVYSLKDIRDGNSEFCYKLQQLFLFFEAHKELLKNEAEGNEDSNQKIDIQFQASGFYGIAPKINLKKLIL